MSNQQSNPINPTALRIADAARLLTAVSGQAISESAIRSDLDSGAPTNADGTINLVHYCAWLVKEMSRSAGEHNGN